MQNIIKISILLILITFLSNCNEAPITILDYPNELDTKIDTIEVSYVNWSCACANWVETDYLEQNSYIPEYKLKNKCFFIEAKKGIEKLPEKYFTTFQNENILRIKLIGSFYKDKGISRDYIKPTSQKPDYAKVFKYSKYEIINQTKKNTTVDHNHYKDFGIEIGNYKGFGIEISNINPLDYEIKAKFDTIWINNLTLENIEGKEIKITDCNYTNITAKIKIEFGFNQYTIDDNPAHPINYTKTTKWINFPFIEKNTIQIPEFFNNYNSLKIYDLFGYNNNNEIEKWITDVDFEVIKNISIQEQNEFYNKLLSNKDNYLNCCPEYITQAKDYINLDKGKIKKISELNLELIVKKIIIKIVCENNYRKIIILNKFNGSC